MKNIKNLLLAASMLALAAFQSEAQTVFAGGGTDISTTNCYAVVSALSGNNGTPVVTYVSATSDLSTSVIQFYKTTNELALVSNSTTTITAANNNITNYVAANAVCVLRHMATDTYEKLYVAAITETNTFTVRYAPVTAVSAGDMIYFCTAGGFIPLGAATSSTVGNGIYSGQKGKPLLIDTLGTSSCQINAVCATYVP